MVDLEGCLVKANCLVAFKPVNNLLRDEIEIKYNMEQIIICSIYINKHWILLVVIGKYRVPPGIVPLCRAASQPSRLRH